MLSGRANFSASESHYAPLTKGCQRVFTPHLVRPVVVTPNIQANAQIRRKAFQQRHLRLQGMSKQRSTLSDGTAERHIREGGEGGRPVRPVSRRCCGISGGVCSCEERGTPIESKRNATSYTAGLSAATGKSLRIDAAPRLANRTGALQRRHL